MGIVVRVNLRPGEIRLSNALERGQFILASQILADSNPYVPELSGDLKRYATISNDNKSIFWTQPYAATQYYATNFVNYTKPGSGPKWDEVAKSKHLDSWLRITGGAYR